MSLVKIIDIIIKKTWSIISSCMNFCLNRCRHQDINYRSERGLRAFIKSLINTKQSNKLNFKNQNFSYNIKYSKVTLVIKTNQTNIKNVKVVKSAWRKN